MATRNNRPMEPEPARPRQPHQNQIEEQDAAHRGTGLFEGVACFVSGGSTLTL
nr:MAG TPA: hypothetical protein [Caudoviricetes sp.]